MAPKGRSVVRAPRTAEELAESIENCRDLIGVADAQIEKARTDLSVARVGLTKLVEALHSRGIVGPSNGGMSQ